MATTIGNPLRCARAGLRPVHHAEYFAFVQTHDAKPKRRLLEALKPQCPASNHQITFLTDG